MSRCLGRKVETGPVKVRGVCASIERLRSCEEDQSEHAVLESRERAFESSTHKPAIGEEPSEKPTSGEDAQVRSGLRPAGADNTQRNTTTGSSQQAIWSAAGLAQHSENL